MPAYDEELFGPVAAIIEARDETTRFALRTTAYLAWARRSLRRTLARRACRATARGGCDVRQQPRRVRSASALRRHQGVGLRTRARRLRHQGVRECEDDCREVNSAARFAVRVPGSGSWPVRQRQPATQTVSELANASEHASTANGRTAQPCTNPHSTCLASTAISLLCVAIVAGTAVMGRASLELVERRADLHRVRLQASSLVRMRRARDHFRVQSRQPPPILTQNASPDARPYIHPIVAPDGTVLTDQTGLFWGFTSLNGRDYFHNPQGGYWRRRVGHDHTGVGREVRWQTVYDLLDEPATRCSTETERWSMREANGTFVLGLDWRGQARRRRHDWRSTDASTSPTSVDRRRWPVPAAAVAQRANGRRRQRRSAAQRPRRRPARDVDRCLCPDSCSSRHNPRRDLRLSRQRRLSTGVAHRSAVGHRCCPARAVDLDDQERRHRGHPPSAR